MKYVLALGLFIALPVRAQTPTHAIEISPFAGYLFGGSLSHSLDPNLHLSVADRLDYGLRIGFNATPAVEPEIQWTRTETNITGTAIPVKLEIDYLLAGASYNFSTGAVRPYISLGLGVAMLNSAVGISSGTGFAASLGVGVKAFFTPNFGIRIEARGYESELPRGYFPFTCVGDSGNVSPVPCVSGWLLNGDVTGGLIFAF